MVEGLGSYTIESGLIYMESILRSSILYAAETYYNLTETDLRLLEKNEEKCLRRILNTGSKCPTYMLYLETAYLPARFYIQKMMAN